MRGMLKDVPWSTALLSIVTLFVLAGSVHHVAYAFSTLEKGNMTWGYIQALGIDLGLLGLTYGIQLRKRQGRPTSNIWMVLGLITFISAYANYLHGITHMETIPADNTFDLIMVAARPFLLAVTLPVIMFALIEILGDDRNYVIRLQEEQNARQEAVKEDEPEPVNLPVIEQLPEPLTPAIVQMDITTALAQQNGVDKLASKNSALDTIVQLLNDNPDMTVTHLSRAIGRSRQTVYAYLTELEENGRIKRNGKSNGALPHV